MPSSCFSKLDAQTQKDLIEWFNVSKPDSADKRRLAKLCADGRFKAWDCPNCGVRVFSGDPKDWGSFQGVVQADHVSFPAVSRATEAWCDHCRCFHQGKVALAEDLADELFH
jgi:hypothetical protein